MADLLKFAEELLRVETSPERIKTIKEYIEWCKLFQKPAKD